MYAGTLTFYYAIMSNIQLYNAKKSNHNQIIIESLLLIFNPFMSQEQDIKMVMVSQKVAVQEESEVDPLEQEILNMKLTANLLKQINFNSAVNKFDYFQTLLASENRKFNKKCADAINNQRELMKKVKKVQKTTKEIKNQTSALNYPKLHVQLEEVRNVKEEVIKYQKLSMGMIKYLEKINEKLSSE